MIYLDNAATTFPKPEAVYDDIPGGWALQPVEQHEREQHPPRDRGAPQLAVL